MTADERYMRAALGLAARGLGSVEPNPVVGAVIVKDGRLTGRGWHRKFGEAHAEVNALADCRKRGHDPAGATMYVTLEPCCHFGKTGPCVEAIISSGITRVVAAMIDPSEHANGAGVVRLRAAGVKVDVGGCEAEARILNAPFVKFARTCGCWVTVKWAQSIDGKLAWAAAEEGEKQRWISGEESRKDAHKLRRRAGAILVGVNTVLADDPLLTPRPAGGRRPVRVVLDSHLRIPIGSQLLATAEDAPTVVVTSEPTALGRIDRVREIRDRGAEVLACPAGRSNVRFVTEELSGRGITHLLVEGGPTVIGSFVKEDIVDEVVVYVAPRILGGQGIAGIAETCAAGGGPDLLGVHAERFGNDVRISGITARGARDIGVNEGDLRKERAE